ncbi:alpha/beta hydrolase [Demequina muriae]|uniref:Alpha/beta hydrolase n=1 Tax=Demequina muriae TaxID=3051664 RepID=A0ABT8GDY5_9MICO|nr:alpha/beta hydrolase [Demequina sp. EGI L300058]MDN4479647.1 alpha/beta hydrolase [Demequina sp. EGI L300058]
MAEVDTRTSEAQSEWSGLRDVYEMAETPTLVSKFAVVSQAGDDFTDALSQAAGALRDLAAALQEARQRVDTLRLEIPQLREGVATYRRSLEEQYEQEFAPDAEVWGPGQYEWNARLRTECLQVETLIQQAVEDCQKALSRIESPPFSVTSTFRTDEPWTSTTTPAEQHERFHAGLASAIFDRLADHGGAEAAALLRDHPNWADVLLDTPPSATQVREWWSDLDTATAQALIAGAPLLVGNLNGVRLDHRIAANRINMQHAIDAEQEEVEALRQRMNRMQGPGNVGARFDIEDQIAAINDRIDVWQGLLDDPTTYVDEYSARQRITGAQVVAFDIERQSVATYHGPIDPSTGEVPSWIENVAVSVPGTGASMVGWSSERAQAIHENDSDGRTAVFQWAGGEFPQSIPGATNASYSHDLAPKLASFVNGLQVPSESSVTVLGHSYGGATVGVAQAEGMKADRILYVAAAGLGDGNSGLTDFPHTADVPQYSLMARNDSVVGAIQPSFMDWVHGPSTLDTPGIVRLETGRIDASDHGSEWIESYNTTGNWSPPAFDSHSTVFTPGSTSFQSIMAVITGGEAELFVPDHFVEVPRQGAVSIPGYLAPDYSPRYTVIK